MAKKNSLKNALITSALSLVLCSSALVGTTYAWFTDSVTSNSNIIQTGTLKVSLEHADTPLDADADEGWLDASTNAIFNYSHWEPGYTVVKYVKVKNEGSLDLKFVLNVIPNNAAAAEVELADVIEVYMLDSAADVTRSALTPDNEAYVGTLTSLMNDTDGAARGTLSAGDAKIYTIALKMSEDAGNEYQGKSVGGGFSVQLLATQLDSESDSIDDQYDKDAEYLAPVSSYAALIDAIEKGHEILLTSTINIEDDTIINGNGITVYRTEEINNAPMFNVKNGKTLTLENITLDGGAVWSGDVDTTLLRGTVNSGLTTSGAIISTENNSKIILNEGAILQNNVGTYAVNLGTRIGATLTVNGGQIINNQSEAGAIWGGGNIVINENSKINGNSSTGIAGVIRMVSSCNLTVNGGEINHNKAAGDGGVIWGYGSSTYTFTGGEMAYNESVGTGGAIYTGTYSVIKISGDFEMHDNKAANSGAIRLTDHTSLTMTGGKIYNNTQNGESNAFNTWNNTMSITGGSISDDFSYVGGVGLTIGKADIDGVIAYNLSTTHNTAYLAAEFNAFAFTVNEEATNFSNFNFKPADGYEYAEGDEAKLVCLNEGYKTYWDAATGTFRLQAQN